MTRAGLLLPALSSSQAGIDLPSLAIEVVVGNHIGLRMVRNMSNIGAALDVNSPVGIPEHFTLVFPADGLHMPCRVAWRKQKRIGVAFDQGRATSAP